MRNFCLLMSVVLLAACGASDSGDKEASGKGGVIPQHQLDAMEKAKNIEDVLNQSELQRREQSDSEG
jgi:hypothetical protein